MPKKTKGSANVLDRMARRAPRRTVTCPACGSPEAVCTHRSMDDAERYFRCRVCGHRWAVAWAGGVSVTVFNNVPDTRVQARSAAGLDFDIVGEPAGGER